MSASDELLIERACRRLIVDSARCNDLREWAALAALYTPTGVVVRPNGQRLEGRGESKPRMRPRRRIGSHATCAPTCESMSTARTPLTPRRRC